MYSVRYNDLMAPMVKAIQEQQTIIEAQQKQIDELKKWVENSVKKYNTNEKQIYLFYTLPLGVRDSK